MQSLTIRSRRSGQHADTLTRHVQAPLGLNTTATGRRFQLGAQQALPAAPEIVAVYLTTEADRGLAPPTLTRTVAAIGFAHRQAGLDPPHKQPDRALDV